MTDSCIICQTEPIEDSDWYICNKTMEVVCPWCVKDMITNSLEKGND